MLMLKYVFKVYVKNLTNSKYLLKKSNFQNFDR